MTRLTAIAMLMLSVACGSVVPADLEKRIAARHVAESEYDHAVHDMLVLETTRGRLIFRLFPDSAPATVKQVRAWVAAGVYDGTWFHRVVREPVPFIVQGGDPETAKVKPATTPVELEAQSLEFGFGTTDPALAPETTSRKHTAGTMALAVAENGMRVGPQFVIALDRLPHLDGQEPVFAHLAGGWSVLKNIRLGDVIVRAHFVPPESLKGDWAHDLPPE